jgi:hypothetical protein
MDDERLGRIESIGNLILDTLTKMKVESDIPMTRKQAAWYLGVSTQTIDNYRSRGILELVVVDGLVGYPLSRLEELKRLKGERRDNVLDNPARECEV